MINGTKLKETIVKAIKNKIDQTQLYEDLFQFLGLNYEGDDFLRAESYIEEIDIGADFVRIYDPRPNLLDFFRTKGFELKVILPALETENYAYNVTAWLEKKR